MNRFLLPSLFIPAIAVVSPSFEPVEPSREPMAVAFRLPLPEAARGPAQCTTGPRAAVRMIEVAPGVQLEVLDWGGNGPPMVFLPGFGNTAHVYAEFAPRFTDTFRVLAITRLGFGVSSRPSSGYDVPSLAAMTLAVLDALSLDTATIVAHSFGGNELTYIAANHPARINAAIYLDAAIDFPSLYATPDWFADWPESPAMTARDSGSVAAVQSYMRRTMGQVIPCDEVLATFRFGPGGKLDATRSPVDSTAGKLLQGLVPAAFGALRTPVLAIYGNPDSVEQMFPFATAADSANAATARRAFERWRRALSDQRAAFQRSAPQARVEVLNGVPHYLFLAAPDEVERLMRDFLRMHRGQG
ncbi:MAG TPA: alpha/beta hydrolase [Gemmatimonadaceae bacterium]